MTTLDVLISTCNNRILDLNQMNLATYPHVRYIIIHQIFSSTIEEEKINTFKEKLSERSDILIHTVKEQGLSKSRNLALSISEADLCLLSDDDITYLDGALPKIIEAFDQSPDEDIITFAMLGEDEQLRRPYPKTTTNIARIANYTQAIDFWSAEIAFRRNIIPKNEKTFYEFIGVGTGLPAGEETLFLAENFRNQRNIAFCLTPICIFPNFHSGLRNDLRIWFARGVVFYNIFGFRFTLHQIRKKLITHCTPANWMRLASLIAGNTYYLIKLRHRMK